LIEAFSEPGTNDVFIAVTIAENGMKALEYLGLGDDSTDTTEASRLQIT